MRKLFGKTEASTITPVSPDTHCCMPVLYETAKLNRPTILYYNIICLRIVREFMSDFFSSIIRRIATQGWFAVRINRSIWTNFEENLLSKCDRNIDDTIDLEIFLPSKDQLIQFKSIVLDVLLWIQVLASKLRVWEMTRCTSVVITI